MTGTLAGRDEISEPVAWTNKPMGGRIVYTSLGSGDALGLPAFRRLLLNGILGALDEPVPPADPRVVVRK